MQCHENMTVFISFLSIEENLLQRKSTSKILLLAGFSFVAGECGKSWIHGKLKLARISTLASTGDGENWGRTQ